MTEREEELRNFAAYCRNLEGEPVWRRRAEWADSLADTIQATEQALRYARSAMAALRYRNDPAMMDALRQVEAVLASL